MCVVIIVPPANPPSLVVKLQIMKLSIFHVEHLTVVTEVSTVLFAYLHNLVVCDGTLWG